MEKVHRRVALTRYTDSPIVPVQRVGLQAILPGNPLVPVPENGSVRVIVVGESGAGKSALVSALCTQKGAWYQVFRRIFPFIPTFAMDPAWIEGINLPKERWSVPCTGAFMQEVLEEWLNVRKPGELAMFILDDTTGTDMIKSPAVAWIVSNGRKFGVSITIIGNQLMNRIPTALRDQASAVFCFRGNRRMAEQLADEFTLANMRTRDFLDIYDTATRGGVGHFLLINRQVPEALRYSTQLSHILTLQ